MRKCFPDHLIDQVKYVVCESSRLRARLLCAGLGKSRNLISQLARKFHNLRSTHDACSSKAKMSALSKVEMSVSAPFWEFGGCYFDGHGGDEQARAEPS